MNDYYMSDGLEVIDVANQYALTFSEGNALKYIARAGKKTTSPLVDWTKAWYYVHNKMRHEPDFRNMPEDWNDTGVELPTTIVRAFGRREPVVEDIIYGILVHKIRRKDYIRFKEFIKNMFEDRVISDGENVYVCQEYDTDKHMLCMTDKDGQSLTFSTIAREWRYVDEED